MDPRQMKLFYIITETNIKDKQDMSLIFFLKALER